MQNLSNVYMIRAGEHSAALTRTGSIYIWGKGVQEDNFLPKKL